MKKNNTFYIVSILLLFSMSCTKVEKDVQNYFPKVITKNVEVLADGSVKVTGEVVKEGTTELYYAGFCMDTLPDPKISLNQKLVSYIEGNTFTAIYEPTFDKFKTYYFRAWVANESWYDVGETLMLDSISFDDAIPCDPNLDSLIITTEFYVKREHLNSIDPMQSGYIVTARTGIRTLEIDFNQKPTGGVYKTTETTSVTHSYTAVVTLDGYKADNNVKFYVEQVDPNTIEIVFCELKVYDGNLPSTLNTRFRVSY